MKDDFIAAIHSKSKIRTTLLFEGGWPQSVPSLCPYGLRTKPKGG